jgi:hypothetical protein
VVLLREARGETSREIARVLRLVLALAAALPLSACLQGGEGAKIDLSGAVPLATRGGVSSRTPPPEQRQLTPVTFGHAAPPVLGRAFDDMQNRVCGVSDLLGRKHSSRRSCDAGSP